LLFIGEKKNKIEKKNPSSKGKKERKRKGIILFFHQKKRVR
jgi:hypothetical protein